MQNKTSTISKKAYEVLSLAMDTLIVNMRFLDVAMNKLRPEEKKGLFGVATDGNNFFYDSNFILKSYLEDENLITRMYLHSLLHCIFNHSFNYDKVDTDEWDLACDIAIENIIMELELPAVTLKNDNDRKSLLRGLKKELRVFTAERLYRYFLVNPLAKVDRIKFDELFCLDRHVYWAKVEDYEISEQAWKKISERIKADLGSFSKAANNSENLIKNLYDATREKQDYSRVLERFVVMSEELHLNDDEFDYIYYTYGLEHYGNMPLIEPLEFRDANKIKDLAIVLDTSASCQGAIIKKFLKATYDILKGQENFFTKINIHIIQADNEVHSDTKITCDADFDKFIENGKLYGYGGTDYRPAIAYIDSLIEDKEFDNFKGLIYFTDGYGIYPEKAPDYDCLFVFTEDDSRRMNPPAFISSYIMDM